MVDGFHIFGEAVGDATGGNSIEPPHGSVDDTEGSPVVEGARSGKDTEEDEGINDDHQESRGNANLVVNTEPEFDLLSKLVRGPPDEPLVHHDGTGLLEKDREDQSEDELPSTCSPDIRLPDRTNDGAGDDIILIGNNISGGSVLDLNTRLCLAVSCLSDFLSVFSVRFSTASTIFRSWPFLR